MAIEKILALTDLSPACEANLATADALAARFGARVDVGHARPPVSFLLRALETALRRRVDEALEKEERATLGQATQRIAPERLGEVRVIAADCVRCGVRDLIEQSRPDLVCVGARGHGAFEELPVGSIAEHAVRTARVPVLLVRGPGLPAPPAPLKVLLAVDLVEPASTSLERVGWLLGPGDELVLAHVVETYEFYPPALGRQPAPSPAERAELEKEANARLREAAAGPDGPRVEVRVEVGPPADTLVSLVRTLAPDLVVARSHAARPWDPTMLGPVCLSLVRRCPTAVLVLPKRA